MTAHHFKELIAWQLATEFKLEAFRLLRGSPEAWRNYKYRDQMIEASRAVALNVVEGFLRKSPGDFCRFLDYSISSVGETEEHVRDGITLNYYDRTSCDSFFKLGRRCLTALVRLKQSQQRYLRQRADKKRNEHPKRPRNAEDR
jgi:four helix bundle protein